MFYLHFLKMLSFTFRLGHPYVLKTEGRQLSDNLFTCSAVSLTVLWLIPILTRMEPGAHWDAATGVDISAKRIKVKIVYLFGFPGVEIQRNRAFMSERRWLFVIIITYRVQTNLVSLVTNQRAEGPSKILNTYTSRFR